MDAEVHVPSAENPALLNVPSFKPGDGQSLVFHALPAARNSAFLISFLSSTFYANLESCVMNYKPHFDEFSVTLLRPPWLTGHSVLFSNQASHQWTLCLTSPAYVFR